MNAYNQYPDPFSDQQYIPAPKKQASSQPAINSHAKNNQTQPVTLNANEAVEMVKLVSAEAPKFFFEKGFAVLTALNAIQQKIIEMGGVSKSRSTNPTKSTNSTNGTKKSNSNDKKYDFSYRSIDDLYNVISPLMAEHKLVCIPHTEQMTVSKYQNKYGDIIFKTCLSIRFIFFSAEDGSRIECMFTGEANDSGDKATSKAASMAQKYLYLQSFSIPTETTHDNGQDHYENEVQNNQHNAPPPQSENRLASLSFKNKVDEFMRPHNNRLSDVLKNRNLSFETLTHAQLTQIYKEFMEFLKT